MIEGIIDLISLVGMTLNGVILGSVVALLIISKFRWTCGLCGKGHRTGLPAYLLQLCDHGGRFG